MVEENIGEENSGLTPRQFAQRIRREREQKERGKTPSTAVPIQARNNPKQSRPVDDYPVERARENIEYTFKAFHDLVAMGLQVPDFSLTPDEARRISDAWIHALQAYGLVHHTKRLVLAPAIGVTIDVEKHKLAALNKAAMDRKPGTERKPPPIRRPSRPGENESPNGPPQTPHVKENPPSGLSGPDAELRDFLSGDRKDLNL